MRKRSREYLIRVAKRNLDHIQRELARARSQRDYRLRSKNYNGYLDGGIAAFETVEKDAKMAIEDLEKEAP